MNQEKVQELVNRSQQEDRTAFALLVSEYQSLVFGLAFRLLCNEDEAKDITQETFVKVWLSLKTYNPETASLHGFTRSLATHVTTDCVRYAILQ